MEFRVFLRSVLIDCHWSINETSAFCMIRQYFLNYLLIFWLLFWFHRWNVIIRPGCCHRGYGKSLRQVSPVGGSFRSRRLAFLRMMISYDFLWKEVCLWGKITERTWLFVRASANLCRRDQCCHCIDPAGMGYRKRTQTKKQPPDQGVVAFLGNY